MKKYIFIQKIFNIFFFRKCSCIPREKLRKIFLALYIDSKKFFLSGMYAGFENDHFFSL